MAEDATAPLLHLVPPAGGGTITVRDLPPQQARIDRSERFRAHAKWGSLGAQTLTNVLFKAEQGDTCDWADLCQFMVDSDDHLGGLYVTRLARVVQADYVIGPNPYGNPRLAQQAADLVNELMLRIENWHETCWKILAGVFYPYSVNEMKWEHDDCKSIPGSTPTNYVKRTEYLHGHRFRYDEVWELRLYDQGRRPKHRCGGSMYGEALDPRLQIVHRNMVRAGYPGIAGELRNVAWRWWFRRLCDQLWATGLEKHGSPVIYASVPGGLKGQNRREILDQLKGLISEHVGVIEQPGELHALTEAVVSYEGYERYMDYSDRKLTAAILGASDVTEPGANGSQAAANTRVSTTTDPRMVTDGMAFQATLHATLYRQMIAMNIHKWPGVPLEQIPIPVGRMKTADDEVKRDPTDRVAEIQAEVDSDQHDGDVLELLPEQDEPVAPKREAPPPKAESKDLLEIVKALTAKQVTPEAACDLLLLAGVDQARAHRMCGVQFGADGIPDPKATAPVAPGPTRKATRPTSGRSPSPFVLGQRGALGGPARSSSRQLRLPLKA